MRFLDWLNRVLIVVALLAVLVLALAIAIAPGAVSGTLRLLALALEQPTFSPAWLTILVGALVVGGAALVLLATELRVRRSGTVALAADPRARVAADTVVQ